jgi:LysM repeat protein
MKRISINALFEGFRFAVALVAVWAASIACSQAGDNVVYITATAVIPTPIGALPNPFIATPTPRSPTAAPRQVTANPRYEPNVAPLTHTVVAGDTLSGVAALYGASVQQIVGLNPGLTDASTLQPGQTLTVPGKPSVVAPNTKIIPDSELVNSPAVSNFNIEAYIRFQPGFIRVYTEQVSGRWMTGAEIIQFFAESASVNPRLLLALLEYRGGWVTNPVPGEDALTYPLNLRDERITGLFNQVAWAANHLNSAYYGWKTRGLAYIEFPDRSRIAFAPEINGGTAAVQHYLARSTPDGDKNRWAADVSPQGFLTTYMALFGDPFRTAIEPLVPADLQQPPLTLPFASGEVWYMTSGPHGGWDARGSGWAAVDFAPPRPPDAILAAQGSCFVSPNYSTAMAAGVVVRSADGAVVIDLDMDGDERTGWTITYLHIAETERIAAGTIVQPGTRLGRPSCEGFYLNSGGTHIHISRRYNGEWIVADCNNCQPGVAAPPFMMGGWVVKGLPNQAYQGYMQNGSRIVRALVGRDDPSNQISW